MGGETYRTKKLKIRRHGIARASVDALDFGKFDSDYVYLIPSPAP